MPLAFREKIYTNLNSPDHQKSALQVLRSGELQREVEKLGFTYAILDKKFDSKEYFTFFRMIVDLKIPIETGEFGDYHGSESHALQIYAMTRGMNEQEINLFRNLYREVGHSAIFGWKIWTAMFDNPKPDVATGPRYWSELMRQSIN